MKRSTFRVAHGFVTVVTVLLLAAIILDFGLYVGSEMIFTLVARPVTEYVFWMPPILGIGALAALVAVRVFYWVVLVLLERYAVIEYTPFRVDVPREAPHTSTHGEDTHDIEGTRSDGS